MSFGEIVCVIVCTFVPVHIYLTLCFFVSEPVVAHVPRFGFFHVDVVVDKSICGRVIYLYWGGWLGVT